jgi:hypothetical protein
MDIRQEKPRADYNCEQMELLAIAFAGWNSCRRYVNDFTDFKPKYTLGFIDGKLAAIKAARAMPDEMVRHAMVHQKLMVLRRKAEDCLIGWQQLKRYIKGAFGKRELFETKLQEAGHAFYRDASKEDWEQVYGLMNAGKYFIAGHVAELTANDNMPLGFENTFDNLIVAFNGAYLAFVKEEEDMVVMTAAKIIACNAVNRDLAEMFADGQHIFRFDAAKRKQFVFEHVRSKVTNARTAATDVDLKI